MMGCGKRGEAQRNGRRLRANAEGNAKWKVVAFRADAKPRPCLLGEINTTDYPRLMEVKLDVYLHGQGCG